MGAKGCKAERGEPIDAFHDSTLKDSILEDIQKRLREHFNIHLKPTTNGVTGPVLVIKDGTNDDVGKLIASSKSLEPNRLLVVLVPKVKDQTAPTERLVLLKNTLDFSKQEAAVHPIVDFIRNYVGNASHALHQASAHATANSFPKPDSTRADELNTRDAQKTASPTGGCSTVFVAFAQDEPEQLLRDAAAFLQDHICEVNFQTTKDPSDTPLLVIFKNDGRLKSDAIDAVTRTRSGSDVMLLVVTDRKELKLDGIEEVVSIGAKERLYWEPCKTRYSSKENREAIRWVLAFLKRFGPDFRRKDSLRHSLRSLGRTQASGLYHALPSIREEMEKNMVFFLEEYNIDLTKTNQPLHASSLVLLASSDHLKEAENFLASCGTDRESVLVVIAQKNGHQRSKVDGTFLVDIKTVTLSLTEFSAVTADLGENKKAGNKVKKFLVKNKPAIHNEEKREPFPGNEAWNHDMSWEQGSLDSSAASGSFRFGD